MHYARFNSINQNTNRTRFRMKAFLVTRSIQTTHVTIKFTKLRAFIILYFPSFQYPHKCHVYRMVKHSILQNALDCKTRYSKSLDNGIIDGPLFPPKHCNKSINRSLSDFNISKSIPEIGVFASNFLLLPTSHNTPHTQNN